MVDQPEAADTAEAQLEELDYRITFPSPTGKDYSDEESDEAEGDGAERPEPVVILLGWLGCQEKHLAKYAAIWDDKRCTTIQYTAPSEVVFRKTYLLRAIAEKLLDLIIGLKLENRPVLFHVFSNGGGIVYRYVSELIATKEKFRNINVIGSIFDSCPAPRSIVTGLKAYFTNFHPKNKLLKCLMMYLCIAFMIISRTWRDIARLFAIDTEAAKQRYWEAMRDDPNIWPHLYLFSVKDKIVHFSDIKRMITCRRAKGIDVHYVMWDRSPHVAHLRFYRQQYIKACYDFLSLCQRKRL